MPGRAAGLVASLEEGFLVPACTSRHARRWVTGHRALSWPLLVAGEVAEYEAGSGGATVRVVTVGRAKRFQEWLGRIGAEPVAAASRRLSLRAPDALTRLDADLVLAEVHRWAAPTFRARGWHTVPSAVRWQARAVDVPPARPGRSLRCDLNLIARHPSVHELGRTAADWDQFFVDMVEPEARARFGSEAWTPSPRLRRRFQARGTLHFVCRDGVRIAGCCTLPMADGVWIPLSGVRHGDPALLKAGAGTAALAATLRWVAEAGSARVDLGRTSPFLDDGVAYVKAKWGFRPVPEPLAHLVALRVRPGCDAARALLDRHPARIETASGLAVLGGAHALA